jgi:sugar phosphate isomerase/epimerase
VDDFERFFDEIGMETRVTFDAAHANLRGETLEFIKRFGERIGHVHVSDNNREVDIHLRLGEGSIDWGETMSALKGSTFTGWVTVESYDGIEESLRLLRKLL